MFPYEIKFREFKESTKVDKVVVLWTANTERYSNVVVGLNDTMENLFASLDRNEAEISPSTLYAIACVMENVPFINGSPQNTFVPGSLLIIIIMWVIKFYLCKINKLVNFALCFRHITCATTILLVNNKDRVSFVCLNFN